MAENDISETVVFVNSKSSPENKEKCCSSVSEESEKSSLSSYDFKLLEGNQSCSENSSVSSTRRNSLTSESDLEGPLQLLFASSSSSRSLSRGTPSQPSEASNILNGIDLLLHRLSSERFLELRRIQLGERPVTGSDARENLENFFHRAIHGPTDEERMQADEENRPVNVANDVESLIQQGLVRSSLATSFREQLERSLSSRMSNTTTSPNRPPHVNNARREIQTQRPAPSSVNNTFRSHLERMYADRLGLNASQPPSSHTRQPQRINRRVSTPPTIQPNLRNTQQPRSSTIPSVEPTFNRSQQPTQASNNLQITLESGMQLLTESITEDLNRLQSLQVVSNMLRGDFREELEVMVEQRVSNVGNGENVQNAIRSLPRTERPMQQMLPQVTNLQSTASINAAMSVEMNSLRQQLDEMKRMMAMQMEIQIDTQRSIRQEVSAIFATCMQQYMSPNNGAPVINQPTLFNPQRSAPVASGQCVICIDRSIDTVLYQCGHMCVCNQCGLQLKIDGHHCPMCRAPIRDVIRAYQAQ